MQCRRRVSVASTQLVAGHFIQCLSLSMTCLLCLDGICTCTSTAFVVVFWPVSSSFSPPYAGLLLRRGFGPVTRTGSCYTAYLLLRLGITRYLRCQRCRACFRRVSLSLLFFFLPLLLIFSLAIPGLFAFFLVKSRVLPCLLLSIGDAPFSRLRLCSFVFLVHQLQVLSLSLAFCYCLLAVYLYGCWLAHLRVCLCQNLPAAGRLHVASRARTGRKA